MPDGKRSITQVEIKSKTCHRCIVADDIVQSKIQKTNQLIENLQKTLNEIRFKTKKTLLEVAASVDSEPEKVAKTTDPTKKTERGKGESEPKLESREENSIIPLIVTEETSDEAETTHLQVPDASPVETNSETIAVTEPKISDEYPNAFDEALDKLRPKTRRPCRCTEKVVDSTDKFRTAPVDGTVDEDEFDNLHAKLNAIVESTGSNVSIVDEEKTIEDRLGGMGGPRVSFVGSEDWLFRDFVSGAASVTTENITTAVRSSQTEKPYQPILVNKNTGRLEIPPKKPVLELSVQVLPSLNIVTEPIVQTLVNFFIDAFGRTHVTYKNEGTNVGFFEVYSSSLTKVFSAENSEIISTANRLHYRKNEGAASSREGLHEYKPSRMKRLRSFSDSELVLSKNGKLKQSPADSLHNSERQKVLQSYQLLDNKNQHDPGVLSALSLDVISTIDENVYKTYINPKGFSVHHISNSNYSTNKPKCATLEKLSSIKSLIKASESDGLRQKKSMKALEKSIQAGSKTTAVQTEPEGAPKLYNIGLYKTKSTQIAHLAELACKHQREAKDEKKKLEEQKAKTVEVGDTNENTQEKKKEIAELADKEMKMKQEKEKVAPAAEEKTKLEKEEKTPETRDKEKSKREEPMESFDSACKDTKREKIGEVFEAGHEEDVEKEEGKQEKTKKQEISLDSVSTPRIHAESSISYEIISMSVSYSTEESITTESSADVVQRRPKAQHSSKVATDKGEKSSLDLETVDDRKYRQMRMKSGSCVRRSKELETFKNLRDKITKEHATDVRVSNLELGSDQGAIEEDGDDISNIAVPTFISGLVETTTSNLKKVIPHIRRSVRVGKSDIRQSAVFAGKSSSKLEGMVEGGSQNLSSGSRDKGKRKSSQKEVRKNSKISSYLPKIDDERELNNHNYNVSPVLIQGDAMPRRYFEKPPERSPLHAEKNGRYRDEEDLFCESNCPKYEKLIHEKFRAVPASLYKSKLNLDSSNSDTITNSERVLSEGEVRCECSVSIGEFHACRRKRSPSKFRRPHSFLAEERGAEIRKRRTYFNNWVTYYLNKNTLPLHDSSSTS
nr:uncharacterized protein LOC111512496 [Leptinotarsa decemlineata]